MVKKLRITEDVSVEVVDEFTRIVSKYGFRNSYSSGDIVSSRGNFAVRCPHGYVEVMCHKNEHDDGHECRIAISGDINSGYCISSTIADEVLEWFEKAVNLVHEIDNVQFR